MAFIRCPLVPNSGPGEDVESFKPIILPLVGQSVGHDLAELRNRS